MGHARATDIYDCAHESVEDTLGYTLLLVTVLQKAKQQMCLEWYTMCKVVFNEGE